MPRLTSIGAVTELVAFLLHYWLVATTTTTARAACTLFPVLFDRVLVPGLDVSDPDLHLVQRPLQRGRRHLTTQDLIQRFSPYLVGRCPAARPHIRNHRVITRPRRDKRFPIPFVNYDGETKRRTTIGSHVRTGSDTMFVAPVTVGDGAYTGAGTVLREDVPPGALAVSDNTQRTIEGWVLRKRPTSASAEAARKAGAAEPDA